MQFLLKPSYTIIFIKEFEKNTKYMIGITACKAEKAWVQKLKDFIRQNFTIFPDSELFIFIFDLKVE